MNLGDDISNLLRNLGHDAGGIYQDLSQYNAVRAARRRAAVAAGLRQAPGPEPGPAEAADPLATLAAPDPAPPAAVVAPEPAEGPRPSLSSILQRLATPHDAPEIPPESPAAPKTGDAPRAGAPLRLDRLFDRLATPNDRATGGGHGPSFHR